MYRPLGPTSRILPRRAVCSHMVQVSWIFFVVRRPMSIASCTADGTPAEILCCTSPDLVAVLRVYCDPSEWRPPDGTWSIETARLHHPARRRSHLAIHRVRAAERQDAVPWHANGRKRIRVCH